jgi:oxygen-independent coproporphyrinogen-3 oxidase
VDARTCTRPVNSPNYGMTLPFSDIDLSEGLIRKFDKSGPRYTSYPTADRFRKDFSEHSYQHYLGQRAENGANPPLSIYVHLPFCESLCYFCACNKIITKDHGRAAEYLRYLDQEMALVAARIGPDRKTVQLHLGGGTPTFFKADELRQLMAMLRSHFDFAPDAELGVEIDPRTYTPTLWLSRLESEITNRTDHRLPALA